VSGNRLVLVDLEAGTAEVTRATWPGRDGRRVVGAGFAEGTEAVWVVAPGGDAYVLRPMSPPVRAWAELTGS